MSWQLQSISRPSAGSRLIWNRVHDSVSYRSSVPQLVATPAPVPHALSPSQGYPTGCFADYPIFFVDALHDSRNHIQVEVQREANTTHTWTILTDRSRQKTGLWDKQSSGSGTAHIGKIGHFLMIPCNLSCLVPSEPNKRPRCFTAARKVGGTRKVEVGGENDLIRWVR